VDTYRIGILSDTHIPKYLPELPRAIPRLFQNVDLILHAGDITSSEALDELRSLAPVIAVGGDGDDPDLPAKTVVEIGRVRIGLIHGQRSWRQELPTRMAHEFFLGHPRGNRFWWGGFRQWLLTTFSQVDAIVFGHYHRPYSVQHNGVLLFSPGAVYHLTPAFARAQLSRTRSWPQRAYLSSWLLRAAITPTTMTGPPTVGRLTIRDRTIEAEVISVSD
jgi:putative phosphoesterase